MEQKLIHASKVGISKLDDLKVKSKKGIAVNVASSQG
jgi:hypothetical protein